MSKRKQVRPSKFSIKDVGALMATEPVVTEGRSSPSSIQPLIVAAESERSSASPADSEAGSDEDLEQHGASDDATSLVHRPVGLLTTGLVFGPYRTATADDADAESFTVESGRCAHHFHIVDAVAAQWIRQLRAADDEQAANCVLQYDHSGNNVQLRVLNDVAGMDQLVLRRSTCKCPADVRKAPANQQQTISAPTCSSTPRKSAEKTSEFVEPFAKCFVCKFCDTRFSNPKTLEAHQAFYCSKKLATVQPESKRGRPAATSTGTSDCTVDSSNQPSTSAVEQFLTSVKATPSVILLPCGYTNKNVVQLLGKPQTIVPVAIPRFSSFAVTPLTLERAWCVDVKLQTKVQISPSSTATVSESNDVTKYGDETTGGFSLPLMVHGAEQELHGRTRTVAMAKPVQNGDPRQSPPLDLRKKVDDDHPQTAKTAPKTAEQPSASDECNSRVVSSSSSASSSCSTTAPQQPPKLFICGKCGVAFSSRKTLDGHQTYYCKASSKSPVDRVLANADQLLSCQYCDLTATTAWQLLEHMKTVHALGSAHICMLCCYRGFSLRGMKSHLKNSHPGRPEDVGLDDEALLAKYVRTTQLFEDKVAGGSNPDRPASNSSARAGPGDKQQDADVDETSCSSPPPPPRKKCKRSPMAQNGDSKTELNDERCKIDSTTSLSSKYQCQFCVYSSPYKGNVKRHLMLVHKTESASGEERKVVS